MFRSIGLIETLSDFIEDYRTKHEISSNQRFEIETFIDEPKLYILVVKKILPL